MAFLSTNLQRLWPVYVLLLLAGCIQCLPIRKNQAHMTQEEISDFVGAVLQLKQEGVYDQFVRAHSLCFPFQQINTHSISYKVFLRRSKIARS